MVCSIFIASHLKEPMTKNQVNGRGPISLIDVISKNLLQKGCDNRQSNLSVDIDDFIYAFKDM